MGKRRWKRSTNGSTMMCARPSTHEGDGRLTSVIVCRVDVLVTKSPAKTQEPRTHRFSRCLLARQRATEQCVTQQPHARAAQRAIAKNVGRWYVFKFTSYQYQLLDLSRALPTITRSKDARRDRGSPADCLAQVACSSSNPVILKLGV